MSSSRLGDGINAAELERFHAALRSVPARPGPVDRLIRNLIRASFRLFAWRVDVSGGSGLPAARGAPGAGCVVAVAPHRAWVEPFLLLSGWPASAARLVWLADGRTVSRSRWRRWFLPRLGVIPIAGGARSPRSYVELAREVLASGHALAVFPEVGPPSAPDRTREFSPGFAYLAVGAGAPVIPVVVGGTHHIVRGSAFSVDLLSPIDSGPAVTSDPFTRATRTRAHALSREVESVIAERLPERSAQADRLRPERDRWRWLATLLG